MIFQFREWKRVKLWIVNWCKWELPGWSVTAHSQHGEKQWGDLWKEHYTIDHRLGLLYPTSKPRASSIMLIFAEGVNVILIEVPIGTCQAMSCSPIKTKRNENQNSITSDNRFPNGTYERSSPWKMESRKWILKSQAKRLTPIALELGHHWASKQVSAKNFIDDKSTIKQQKSRTDNLVIISALRLNLISQ